MGLVCHKMLYIFYQRVESALGGLQLLPLSPGCWVVKLQEGNLVSSLSPQPVCLLWLKVMRFCPAKLQEILYPASHGLKSPQVGKYKSVNGLNVLSIVKSEMSS